MPVPDFMAMNFKGLTKGFIFKQCQVPIKQWVPVSPRPQEDTQVLIKAHVRKQGANVPREHRTLTSPQKNTGHSFPHKTEGKTLLLQVITVIRVSSHQG